MKHIYTILAIIGIGLIVYFNSLSHGFILDDQNQILKPTLMHSIKNIPVYFNTSLRNPEKQGIVLDSYYKPLLYTFYSVLYTIGNGKPLYFHLFQVILHSINALLVFYLFKHVFKTPVAFLLSLLFLVHPGNEETVVYIASLQEVLFFFFGMLGLLILRYQPFSTKYTILLSALCMLLSLLSKETGILFVFCSIFFVYLFKKKQFILYLVYMGGVIVTYTVLRVHASQHYFLQLIPTDVMHETFLNRIIHIPQFVNFYMRELFLPTNLITSPVTTFYTNINTLDVILFAGILLLSLILFVYLRQKLKGNNQHYNYFIFFVIWFLTGIGMHLQLVALDTYVAKRWLYFPMVGVLGIIGFSINMLHLEARTWRILGFIISIVILLILGLETMTMNSYWKNENLLKSHTIQFSQSHK